jgi:hypothetical protein
LIKRFLKKGFWSWWEEMKDERLKIKDKRLKIKGLFLFFYAI